MSSPSTHVNAYFVRMVPSVPRCLVCLLALGSLCDSVQQASGASQPSKGTSRTYVHMYGRRITWHWVISWYGLCLETGAIMHEGLNVAKCPPSFDIDHQGKQAMARGVILNKTALEG